ncbi:hypothetical protein PoB_003650600 [Plakobranchus ocellatus]|uniref:Uncharacterized protein n=1 Tax=Plakobranchus ocellatus TaxID=259542 RepID=A0AAV4AFQ3_9GAST|nr:hypothetical protein PoB_003650600 [Plakobranchus ocellatus]
MARDDPYYGHWDLHSGERGMVLCQTMTRYFGGHLWSANGIGLLRPGLCQFDRNGLGKHDAEVERSLSDMKPFYNKLISGFQALRQARARDRDRRVHADFRAGSLFPVPPMPHLSLGHILVKHRKKLSRNSSRLVLYPGLYQPCYKVLQTLVKKMKELHA